LTVDKKQTLDVRLFTTAAMPDRRGGWLFSDFFKYGGSRAHWL
jgi:hypothetical protein